MFERLIRSTMGRDNLRGRAMLCILQDDEASSFKEWSSVFSDTEVSQLIDGRFDSTRGVNRGALESNATEDYPSGIHFAPAMDQRYRLVDYILARTDKLSMATSLEVRVPFLDHRLIELIARVPIQQKIRKFEGKKILRKIAVGLLLEEVINRRKKPFGSPTAKWIDVLKDKFLKDSQLVKDGVLNGDPFFNLVEQHPLNADSQTKLWSLIILEIWYRIFIKNDTILIAESNYG